MSSSMVGIGIGIGIDIARGTFDIATPLSAKGKYRTKSTLPNDPTGFAQQPTRANSTPSPA